MALWTDEQWWEANIKDLPAKLFHLGCVGTRNRKPVFPLGEEVDWERVQALVTGEVEECSPPDQEELALVHDEYGWTGGPDPEIHIGAPAGLVHFPQIMEIKRSVGRPKGSKDAKQRKRRAK